MAFGLTPRQHLQYLTDEHAEFRRQPASVRLGINCCIWADHLADTIFLAYQGQRQKGCDFPKVSDYKASLRERSAQIAIVGDLCNFAKHGKITRYDPMVRATQVEATQETDWLEWMHERPSHIVVDRLVATVKTDAGDVQLWLDDTIEGVLGFWRSCFDEYQL